MSRIADVQRLYEILVDLEKRLGGARQLGECHGRLPWPARGIYFFFEEGERRSTSGSGSRVVRVGTHALASKSIATLWNRLSQHRGSAMSGGGNHRGSIFRLIVGEALLRRGDLRCSSWGLGSSAGAAAKMCHLSTQAIREQELAVEREVSRWMGAMPFVWVEVDDAPGPESLRGFIERNAISLLSNFDKDPVDEPSRGWLGLDSPRERVRRSGLWNNNHVDEEYDPSFLDVLERLARETSISDIRSVRPPRETPPEPKSAARGAPMQGGSVAPASDSADCPFCSRIASAQVDLGNELATAFPDGFPLCSGHTLVVPRRHVASYFDLTLPEQTALWKLVSEVKKRLDREHGPAGYNIGVNVGAAGGQTVWHAHAHVIPRYTGDVEDPRGGVRWVIGSRAPYWKERE